MYIIFDLDDTLVDSEQGHIKAINLIYQDYFPNLQPKFNISHIWLNITNQFLELYFKGELSLEQQRVARIQKFWEICGAELNRGSAKKIYEKYDKYFLNSCLNFDDTNKTLQQLSKFELMIISNGSYADQIYKLKNNNLMKYFKQIFISDKVGFSKPDKRIFQYAANELNTNMSNCLYIGNSYPLDYISARDAGMKAIWLDRNSTGYDIVNNKISSLIQLTEHPILHAK
ncbi:HAD family hydrolase [Maribacter sp. ANRC-HE7]|uniref:HAD family hydrolase n=1 Tax=Maribacter aquimaris TaxID=2737171 RepID=A0ABR7UZ52_9FLAO|nr:HAD family hydrolase [Maribacter aquimaris]MBD0777823.1 HAD family hydrolase [Maribacter aquimaris]